MCLKAALHGVKISTCLGIIEFVEFMGIALNGMAASLVII